ncbi:hypothetical protein P4E94_04395 [Pontiellaceae bacterium B12219]|nr:hypothetical protein [Pontiellaceae bacterium B12219]
MNRTVRLITAIASLAGYLAVLRYVAPPDRPYFILGIGIVGLVTWLLGTVQGIIATVLLVPLTAWIYQQFQVSASYTHFASTPAYLGLQIILVLGIGYMRRENLSLRRKQAELEETNHQLQRTLGKVQELGGIHNMCSGCKKIQDDEGIWQSIDAYLKAHTKMEFSHCICPDCARNFRNASEKLSS